MKVDYATLVILIFVKGWRCPRFLKYLLFAL